MEESREVADAVRGIYASMVEPSGPELFISREAGFWGAGGSEDETFTDGPAFLDALAQEREYGIRTMSTDLNAYREGSVGWANDWLQLTLPDGSWLPMRFTCVLHLEDGTWKVVQWHASFDMRKDHVPEYLVRP